MPKIGRRGFLASLGVGVATLVGSAAFDPERALWVPGQRRLFLPPQRPLVQARTLQEALSKGLTALFPDGSRMRIGLSGGFHVSHGMTGAEMLAAEVRGVEAMGGFVLQIGDLQPGWNW